MQQKNETHPQTVKQWWPEAHLLPGDLSNLMVPRTCSSACAINENVIKGGSTLKPGMIHHPLVHLGHPPFDYFYCSMTTPVWPRGHKETPPPVWRRNWWRKLDVSSRMRKKMVFSTPHFPFHYKTVAHEVLHVALPDRLLVRLTAAWSNRLLLTHRLPLTKFFLHGDTQIQSSSEAPEVHFCGFSLLHKISCPQCLVSRNQIHTDKGCISRAVKWGLIQSDCCQLPWNSLPTWQSPVLLCEWKLQWMKLAIYRNLIKGQVKGKKAGWES